MKIFTVLFSLFFVLQVSGQEYPRVSFVELINSAEQNSQQVFDARKLADKLGLPHTIYTADGKFIEAKGIENGKVVYSVITDISSPQNGSSVSFWSEIQQTVDLTKSRVHYSKQETTNPTLGYSEIRNTEAATYLMVIESTTDKIMLFNPVNGDLIETDFIVDAANFNTPIEALLSPVLTVLTSNQVGDNVVIHDTAGTFNSVFYGGNTAVLDNIRGTEFTPNFTSLLVTVAASANANAIAQFDPAGNYVGNFIAIGAGGLASPFDIVRRTNDYLVASIDSDQLLKYDLTGAFVSVFASGITFPEQISIAPNGNVLLASFSTPNSGVIVYDSLGNQLNVFSAVTGNRGVYPLSNGNILTTNGSGVHELDGTTGALLRTIVAGISGRFISPMDFSIIPVELTSFVGSNVNGSVVLNWNTATETNNSGFEIQRSPDRINFSKIAFVPGFGTTTVPQSYTYTDNSVNSNKYYYRLRQIDYDGQFAYSQIIEVDVASPNNFSLIQNYPNPFNPSTIISYNIPQNSFVILKVYDVLGNEVATLVNETKEAGRYNVNFDASSLSTGIYLYTINAGRYSSTKKMLLIK